MVIVDGVPDCNSEGGDEKSSSESSSTESNDYFQFEKDSSGNKCHKTKIVLPEIPPKKQKETVSPANSNKSDNSTLSEKV